MEQMVFFQALIILMLIMPLIILGGIYSGMITQPVGNCLNTCSEDGFRFSGA